MCKKFTFHCGFFHIYYIFELSQFSIIIPASSRPLWSTICSCCSSYCSTYCLSHPPPKQLQQCSCCSSYCLSHPSPKQQQQQCSCSFSPPSPPPGTLSASGRRAATAASSTPCAQTPTASPSSRAMQSLAYQSWSVKKKIYIYTNSKLFKVL